VLCFSEVFDGGGGWLLDHLPWWWWYDGFGGMGWNHPSPPPPCGHVVWYNGNPGTYHATMLTCGMG